MRISRSLLASAAILTLAALPFAAAFSGCQMMEGSATVVEPAVPYTPLPDLQNVGLKQSWQRHLPLAANERIRNAWRVGKSIYVSTNQARLFRLDKDSGVLEFSVGLSVLAFDIYKPMEFRPDPDQPATDVLVCIRGGEAFVLDRNTGDVKEQKLLSVSLSSQPVAVGNVMCAGGANRFIGMYIDRLGVKRWVITMEDDDLFVSTPVIAENDVIVASHSGHLGRYSTLDGDWSWKDRKTNGVVEGGLAADGARVYVPCLDQRLYAFNIDTGGELWQCQLEGALDTTPALGGDVVMVMSRNRGIYGVDRKSGQQRWFTPGINSVSTVTNDHVWVSDSEGNLKSLALDTGEVISSTPVAYAQVFVRNTDDDQVVLVNKAGVVGAYDPK